MSKLFIDKNKKQKFTVTPISRDSSQLKEQFQKKIITKISQLQIISKLPPDRQSNQKSIDELISDLFVLFDQIKNDMSIPEMDTLYDLIRPYISDEKIAEIAAIYSPIDTNINTDTNDNISLEPALKKKTSLRFDYSTALLITNKQKQGPSSFQYPILYDIDDFTTNKPFTIAAWIKPNSINYSVSKIIFRHYIQLTNDLKIGHTLKLNNNNEITFSLYVIPKAGNSSFIYDIKLTENKINYRNWNYIYYGISEDNKLFIGVDNSNNRGFKKTNNSIDNENVYDLKNYMHSILPGNYPNPIERKPFNVGNFYWQFPQLLIGGIETTDLSTELGQLDSNNNTLPNSISNLVSTSNKIYNGLYDFDIASFRYYNKELTESEILQEKEENNLKDNLPLLYNNCFLDLQFKKIYDEKIEDLSGHGNHGYLLGDMKILFQENSDSFTITDKKLPQLINVEGPY